MIAYPNQSTLECINTLSITHACVVLLISLLCRGNRHQIFSVLDLIVLAVCYTREY